MHTISYMAFLSARICAGVTSCMTLAFISIALVLATNSLLLASATWGEGGRPVVRGRRNAAREAVKVWWRRGGGGEGAYTPRVRARAATVEAILMEVMVKRPTFFFSATVTSSVL